METKGQEIQDRNPEPARRHAVEEWQDRGQHAADDDPSRSGLPRPRLDEPPEPACLAETTEREPTLMAYQMTTCDSVSKTAKERPISREERRIQIVPPARIGDPVRVAAVEEGGARLGEHREIRHMQFSSTRLDPPAGR